MVGRDLPTKFGLDPCSGLFPRNLSLRTDDVQMTDACTTTVSSADKVKQG